jgi:hypothetical protein
MEYLKIWGFQNSTIIAEVESFGILGPKTRYGPLKQKSRAILALPLMYCTNMKLFYTYALRRPSTSFSTSNKGKRSMSKMSSRPS